MLDQHSVVFGSMLVDSMKNVRWIVFGFSIEGRRVFDRRSLNVWKMLHGFSVGRSIDVQSMTARMSIGDRCSSSGKVFDGSHWRDGGGEA